MSNPPTGNIPVADTTGFFTGLKQWVQTQRLAYPLPPLSNNDILENYAKAIKYAYENPRGATDFLKDMQSRFFSTSCKFRYQWNTDTITSPIEGLDTLIKTVNTPETNVEAIEAYRKVVDSFVNQSSTEILNKIRQDMLLRYFDPRSACSLRAVPNAIDYTTDFAPVFR